MGTKISAMTTTGSAPSNSYLPLAYDGKNYKIEPENVGGGGGTWSSGWQSSFGGVSLFQYRTYTLTHNLGTTDVISQLYCSTSAGGSSPFSLDFSYSQSMRTFNAQVVSLGTNTITIRLGYRAVTMSTVSPYYTEMEWHSPATKYIKVVVQS